MHYDTVIVGQGLAGALSAWKLGQCGQKLLIIDNPDPARASAVASGILNPLTGQRLALPSYINDWLQQALTCYRCIERNCGVHFLRTPPVLRIHESTAAATALAALRLQPEYQAYFADIDVELSYAGLHLPFGYVGQRQVYHVDIRALLQGLRTLLSPQHEILHLAIDPAQIEPVEHGVRIRFTQPADTLGPGVSVQEISADRVIFCEGSGVQSNPWFAWVPFVMSKGESLQLQCERELTKSMVHGNYWLVPLGQQQYRFGATYEWEYENDQPTAANRTALLAALHGLVTDNHWQYCQCQVTGHVAGIRPGTIDRMPVVGCHPDYPQIMLVNGLGAKGLLYAPHVIQQLCDFITEQIPVSPQLDVRRFAGPPESGRDLVSRAQARVAAVVAPGEVVVDATIGNGLDTLFLAQTVGPAGRVFGFDIQSEAIVVTHKRLIDAQQAGQVTLLQQSHSNLLQVLQQAGVNEVAAVMFNLGYRPGGDKTITSQFVTTQPALEQALGKLRRGGVITLLLYTGHTGGKTEALALLEWLEQLDPVQFELTVTNSYALPKGAPVLVCILKR